MTICGIASKSSTDLNPKIKQVPLSLPQEMLVISYDNVDGTFTALEASAKSERFWKFVGGTLCFMIGFSGLFGPIIKILDFIPFLGKLATSIIYFILAIVSLLLSVLFYVFFQIFWILVAIAVLVPIALLIMNFMKKKTA